MMELRKSITIQWPDLFKALAKGGMDLVFQNWSGLATDGVDLLGALGLSTSPETIAWLLVYRSILLGMKNLIEERNELKPLLEDKQFQILQKKINNTLKDKQQPIDQEFFTHPERSELVQAVCPVFQEWLQGSEISGVDATVISQRLPIYFAFALQEEWGNRSQEYQVLKGKLDTPFTQANERHRAWLRYNTWLQKQIEEPMFLEAFGLKQVFVNLRAYYDRKSDDKDRERDWEETTRTDRTKERVVVDLLTELNTWLDRADQKDPIRLLSGGPGSGKSSITKVLAAQVAAQGKLHVLLVPLHRIDASGDLIEAVGKFVRMDGFLSDNPLTLEHLPDRLLLIFDGLDELALQGRIAERNAQEFVQEVQGKISHLNQTTTRVQVLLSGREVVVQASETLFRKEGQILHVLPYIVSKNDREQHKYTDSQKLLDRDQRQLWWQNYGKASGQNYTGLPSELNGNNLLEITAQPLLNYLVALSLSCGQLQFSAGTNLNLIYADLLKAVYERDWGGGVHRSVATLDDKDFQRALEAIALATWHGNGRTTTIKEIELHCPKELLERFKEAFADDTKASVTRLLTAFYFRRSGYDLSGEGTFEFTHKSFGEYLTAQRILREVRLLNKKLKARKADSDEGWDEREALHRWVLLCGLTPMDEYLFSFVQAEVNLQKPEEVAHWQQMFCHLVGYLLKEGMPMERLQPRPSYQEEDRQARNAIDSLLGVLGACQQHTKTLSKIHFPSPSAFGTLLSRIQGQRVDCTNPIAFHCLSYLDLSNCNLIFRDFYRANLEEANLAEAKLAWANLEGANLEGANLERAKLVGAKLAGAILSGANLAGANLWGANLWGANLEGAYLARADLSEAYLARADLSGANLLRANLSGAILEGANLEGADLVVAKLVGANLEGANLEGANLVVANLVGANLEGANLEGANLERANLEGANLEGAKLEGAKLEGANLEGAKLERAKLERAKLVGANLEGAKLEGAKLERANLEGANLEGANLERAKLWGAILKGTILDPEVSQATDHNDE